MFTSYLKVSVRNLSRHKVPTFINVAGLSLGIAVCIMIMVYIRQELSYDTFHGHADDIYRVLTDQKAVDGSVSRSAFQPLPMLPALRSEFPEIQYATRSSTGGTIIVRDDKVFEEEVLFVDPDFFRMFSFPLVQGDPSTALMDPSSIVLTEKMAVKYFGDDSPIGKQVTMRNRRGDFVFTVSGVAKNVPANSSITFNIVANLQRHSMYERSKDRWTSSNGSAFIRLTAGASGKELESKLPAFVQKYYGETISRWQDAGNLSKDEDAWKMSLQPIGDVHLNTSVGVAQEAKGDPAYSYILAGIGLLVLGIACLNFIILAIGRSASRAKEVGVRKVLGAVRNQLVTQFWGEAVLLTGFSLVFGYILAQLMLPTFATLAGTSLSLDPGSDTALAAGLVGLLLITGIAAGSYPAVFLSRFQPVDTLKGKVTAGRRGFFTKTLIVFQFGLSIFLVCLAIVFQDQITFLITKNLGFRPQQVVVLPLYGQNPEQALQIAERVRNQISQNPDVLSTSVTSGAFTHGYDINGFQVDGENKSIFTYRIDENYLETLGIPLKDGRNFIPTRQTDIDKGMIVNESFLRTMGWPEPAVGRKITGSDSKMMEDMEVVGVVPDFHYTSLRQEIRPVVLFMNPDWTLDDMLIRISARNVPATMQYLRSVWREVSPSSPFNASFLDEDFRKQYDLEMRWGTIISLASGFAISLACLGLFGLITVAVAARTKEIGIRKVLGSSGVGIVRLVSKEFMKLVLLGNLIAWPIAYLAVSTFLENYAYRIDIGVTSFLIAGLLAFAVAMLTISAQVIRAARANPVESLRYE